MTQTPPLASRLIRGYLENTGIDAMRRSADVWSNVSALHSQERKHKKSSENLGRIRTISSWRDSGGRMIGEPSFYDFSCLTTVGDEAITCYIPICNEMGLHYSNQFSHSTERKL